MKKLYIYAVLPIFLSVQVTGAYADRKPYHIKVLFLIGGASHEWDRLTPILVDRLKATGDFEITLSKDRNELTYRRVKNYDTVIFFTQGGEITSTQLDGLQWFVRTGGGFVGLHSATATFKTSDDYWEIIAGRFIGHGKKRTFEIRITDTNHPITKGIGDFNAFDEDYRHTFHPSASITVLARRPEGDPVIWVREYGAGRVFINALGHGMHTWSNQTFQEIAVRAMYWVSGVPVESK